MEEKVERIIAIEKGMRWFWKGNEPLEYRSFRPVLSGVFDDLYLLACEVVRVEDKYKGRLSGSYFQIHKLKPEWKERITNKITVGESGKSVGNSSIGAYNWFYIDFDAKRDNKPTTNSTDEQHEYAIDKAREVEGWLRMYFLFPEGILVDSANGCHLYFLLDTPSYDFKTNPAMAALAQECLKVLAKRFDDEHVEVDLKMWKAGQLSKIPYTWVSKGKHSTERPHRMSKPLNELKKLRHVNLEALEKLRDSEQKEGGKNDTKSESSQESKEGIKCNVEKLKEKNGHKSEYLFA